MPRVLVNPARRQRRCHRKHFFARAHTGAPGEWVHYAATKGAIDSFTIGLAREVATEGIRVNAVAPGLVETDLHAASGEPGRLQRLMPTIPMRRAGLPHEVADECCGCCRRLRLIAPVHFW